MKAKKRQKCTGALKKSRKEIRKETRKQKKIRKHEYYTNRNKGGRFVLNPDRVNIESMKPLNKPLNKENRTHEKVEKQVKVIEVIKLTNFD